MFCKKCGTKLNDDDVFCPECGTRMRGDDNSLIQSSPVMSIEPVNSSAQLQKKTKTPLMLAIALLFLVAIFVVVIVCVKSNSPANRLRKQLDLGNRYLSEMNYEQAIACFEAAIEIEPKETQAYQGLIDAYIGLNDSDGIFRVYDLAVASLDENEVRTVRESASNGYKQLLNSAVEEGDYERANVLLESYFKIDSYGATIAKLTVKDIQPEETESSNESENETNDENINEVSEPEPEPEPVATIYQPTDEEVYAAFEFAYDIACSIEWADLPFIQVEENSEYLDCLWAPISNIKSINELNQILDPYFSDRQIKEFDNHFKMVNGKLYGIDAGMGRGRDITAGAGWASEIKRIDDKTIIVVYKQEEGDFYNDPTVLGYRYFDFKYIYEDGKWVFDEIYCTY